MNNQTPEKKLVANTSATTASPTNSLDSLIDPPDYIAPELQDMMLMDITSAKLHDQVATNDIGRGKPYLSPAGDGSQPPWPAYGAIFGSNKRLMINIPCRRANQGSRGVPQNGSNPA